MCLGGRGSTQRSSPCVFRFICRSPWRSSEGAVQHRNTEILWLQHGLTIGQPSRNSSCFLHRFSVKGDENKYDVFRYSVCQYIRDTCKHSEDICVKFSFSDISRKHIHKILSSSCILRAAGSICRNHLKILWHQFLVFQGFVVFFLFSWFGFFGGRGVCFVHFLLWVFCWFFFKNNQDRVWQGRKLLGFLGGAENYITLDNLEITQAYKF